MSLLSIHGQSHIEFPKHSNDSCFDVCPPGFHKIGHCNNPLKKYRCAECGKHTFTDASNSLEECLRCDVCGSNQVEIQPCNFTNDVLCACKEGYYNAGSQDNFNCLACRCEACKDYGKRLHYRQEPCLKNAKCKQKCATSTTAADKTTLTTATKLPPRERLLGHVDQFFIITAVVLFCLLCFCTCFALHLRLSFCWRIKNTTKGINGAHNHLASRPTTLRANVCEETQIRIPCHSSTTPVCVDHMEALLTDTQHKDSGLEKVGGHWPPIVLYAIINEVPLRRWKEFLRMLSVADHQLDRIEVEGGSCLLEKQYQMLRLWSQHSSARLEHILSALHDMDLSGCAQMLQERLERLQWRDQLKDGVTTC
ncbi:tumor necrosis factor receptor superfamily member 1A isoform X2 [Stigmatopora nigra]